jgi:hypothetical protein
LRGNAYRVPVSPVYRCAFFAAACIGIALLSPIAEAQSGKDDTPPGLRSPPRAARQLYRSYDSQVCWPYLLYERGQRRTLPGTISWRTVPFDSLSEVEKARYVKQRFSRIAEQLCLRARGDPSSSAPRPDPELDRCIEARSKTLFEHQASFAPIVAEAADIDLDGDGVEERIHRIYFDKPPLAPYPFKAQGEGFSPYISIHHLGENEWLREFFEFWGGSYTQIITDRSGRALVWARFWSVQA